MFWCFKGAKRELENYDKKQVKTAGLSIPQPRFKLKKRYTAIFEKNNL